MSDYSTILVATDMSDPAATATAHAGRLARKLGSRLVLVYVVEDRLPPMVAQSAPGLDKILDEHRRTADASLKRWADLHVPDAEVERVICQGAPHACILDVAKDKKADLIVVGMQGHNYLTHVLVGSTAERVLHGAPCPVLIVGRDC